MRRRIPSTTVIRVRAFLGPIYVLLGIVLVVRTVTTHGLQLNELPALILGAALVGLGSLHVRHYLQLRKQRAA